MGKRILDIYEGRKVTEMDVGVVEKEPWPIALF